MTQLDPAFAAAVAELDSYDADWIGGDPEDLRREYAAARALLDNDVARACKVRAFSLKGGLSGLVFTPEVRRSTDQAIVYFHGGSWCVGSPETHRVPCSHLAVGTGLSVISVDYRLAPEHPFPAQREDGVRVAEAVMAGEIEAAQRIVLAGDSAGAALAFWTERGLPEGSRARVDGLVGFYGGYGNIPADRDAGETDGGLSAVEIRAAYRRLGPLDTLRAAPGFVVADAVSVDGPPCFLSVGDADPLLADSENLATKLKALGRPTTLDICPGLGHSFAHYVARVPAAKQALKRASDWICALAA